MSEDWANGGLAPEQIRAALGRVAASAPFAAAPRMRDFLSYVVEETLAGRGDEIKGYSLALEVFRKGDSFDPANDSVVRVEAARLRRTLSAYYEGEGRDDPVIIGIPKGGYVPEFRARPNGAAPVPGSPLAVDPPAVSEALQPQPAAGAGQGERAPEMQQIRRPGKPILAIATALMVAVVASGAFWLGADSDIGLPPLSTRDELSRPARPTIAVMPFEATFGTERDALLGRGLAADISAALTGFHELIVLFAENGTSTGPGSIGATDVSRYRLQGTVASQRGTVRVLVQLLDARTNRSLWAQSYERQLSTENLFELQDEITQQVAATIADPYGVIWQSEISQPRPPQSVSAYYCALRAYDYWRELSPELHAKVRDCLEDAIKDEPDYAVAWAALAYFYMDEYRYGYNQRPDSAPLDRALASANKAVTLDPFDARAYQALYTVQFLRGDKKEFQRIGKKALELNRNSLDLVGDYGAKLAMSGYWEAGLPLVRNAVERNPAPPGWLYTPLIYYEYMNANYKDALAYVDRMNTPDYYRTHVLRAMIYGQLGDAPRAKAALDQVQRLKPSFLSDPLTDMRHWGLAPDILAASIEGLKKAGLTVPESQG